MEKTDYIIKVNKYFSNDITRRRFIEQIEEFFNYDEENQHSYEIDDDVVLTKNCYLHGSRIKLDKLKEIVKVGIISIDFLEEANYSKKKPFVVEFFNVEKDMLLKEFLDVRCGVTIEFMESDGKIKNKVISSIRDIENKIKIERNFRDYIIFQNQEQRFIPNNYIDNGSNFAFIIRNDSENKARLLVNDIFDINFDQNILKDIVPQWFYEKYLKERNFDNNETGREKAILFGIPSKMIEGIIVSREIEKNIDDLKFIKSCFRNCYICNVDGKVILK